MKPPPGVTLLLGGARSGKSDLAVRLASAFDGAVTFVATADDQADGTLAARVARHQTERPGHWPTVVAPRDLALAVRAIEPASLVVVDCLTIWVSNLMVDGLDEDRATAIADELLIALHARPTPAIVVTNEVGLGVHPSSELGREYRDVLGRVNRRVAEGATRAVFVVAGRALPLTAPEDAFR